MKYSTRITAAISLLTLTSSSFAQAGLQVLIGTPGQPGAITAYDELSGAPQSSPIELQGVSLLPIDFNGRLASDDLLASRPKFRGDVPGASRIELPGRLGVLYRFSREELGGARSFGFLRIDSDGAVHLLAERPGTGLAADQDPYADRVALAPDSRAMLTCTQHAAGGDLLEVHLITGAVINRTPHYPPLIWRAQSLRMASDWLTAVCSRAVLRSGRAPLDLASRVPGISNAPLFTGELSLSPSGTYAMTTIGVATTALDVWAFGPTGLADKVSTSTANIHGAGFLPEAGHGPFFAISDDGKWCAWTAEIALKRELFMRENSAQSSAPETHVSSDSNFADTLEEIGALGMYQPGKLLMAIGEPSLDFGVDLESADFFEVQLDTNGTPSFTNLTMTSGQSAPPFLAAPQMTPTFVRWLPAAGAFLMYDEQSGGTGRIVAVRPGVNGVQVLMNDVKQVDFIEQVGNRVVISLRLATGLRQHQLVKLPSDLSTGPVVVHDGGDDSFLQPLAALDRWIVFTEVPDFGPQRLGRVDLATGAYQSFALAADAFGPGIGLTSGGELAFGFTLGGAPRLAIWPFGGSAPFVLQTPGGQGSLLPGR
jgi:hypothetical protein